ncbi:hypothetical protein ACTZWW_07890 [Salinarimonas sp. NSM]|uniref:hypothetical protein n=1 Tax=Salinarimonas sp. NSM TaxID=3458003 RepID=UPI004035342C
MSKRDVSSADLKAVQARVAESNLSDGDKSVLAGMLDSAIELKALLENSSKDHGGKKVIASLPFGFDIVK